MIAFKLRLKKVLINILKTASKALRVDSVLPNTCIEYRICDSKHLPGHSPAFGYNVKQT